ncbi:MAG: serine protease, partial [Chloroflexota bacterium]
MRYWIFFLASTLLGMYSLSALAQQDTPSLDLNRIQRATVFVIQASDSDLDTRCVGSGTIVRFDGLILTNAHNVVPSEACPGNELIISMSLEANEPPVPKYRASIAQIDLGLDLALLRIDRELDGRIIEPENLPILPFVELGNSNDVILDDTLTLAGYPDLGNSPTLTQRVAVAAFMAEPSGGDKSWFKLTSNS